MLQGIDAQSGGWYQDPKEALVVREIGRQACETWASGIA